MTLMQSFGPNDQVTHFAVELLPNEASHDVVHTILTCAADKGILFRALELYGTFQVGTAWFVRCRTDLKDVPPLLDALFKAGRGVVEPTTSGCIIRRGKRTGVGSGLLLHSAPQLGQQRMYRGTQVAHWEKQFLPVS